MWAKKSPPHSAPVPPPAALRISTLTSGKNRQPKETSWVVAGFFLCARHAKKNYPESGSRDRKVNMKVKDYMLEMLKGMLVEALSERSVCWERLRIMSAVGGGRREYKELEYKWDVIRSLVREIRQIRGSHV